MTPAKFLWIQKQDMGPKARGGHAAAFDESRQRVIAFGGEAGGQFLDDTWSWDGALWTQLADTGPSARSLASMVFTNNAGGIVLFGGHLQSGTLVRSNAMRSSPPRRPTLPRVTSRAVACCARGAALALVVACGRGPTATEQSPIVTLEYGTWIGANAVAELELRVNPFVLSNTCGDPYTLAVPYPPYEVTGTYRDLSMSKSVALCAFPQQAPSGRVRFWLALADVALRPSATLQYIGTEFVGRFVDANSIDAVLYTQYNRDFGSGSWSVWTADSSAITLRRR